MKSIDLHHVYSAWRLTVFGIGGLVVYGWLGLAVAAEDSVPRVLSDEAQAMPKRSVTLSASMPGEVSAVDVTEGSTIAAGDRLVQLDDALANAEFVAAKRAQEAAEIEAANDVDTRYAIRTKQVREREFQQSEAANRSFGGTVSATEIDRLRLEVDQAALAIEQAEFARKIARAHAAEKAAAVDAAAVRLGKHAVLSPYDGVVVEVLVQVGQRVDAGEPLVRVVDVKRLRVECVVDSEIAKSCKPGDKVRFEYQDGSAEGKLEFVSPEINPVTKRVRVIASLENDDLAVRPGTAGRLVASTLPQ